MTVEEEAAKLLPCLYYDAWPEVCIGGHVPRCAVHLRPAVAAALRERDEKIRLLGHLREHYDKQLDDRDERREELRKAVAELRGIDIASWPTHGNVELAITAAIALDKERIAACEAALKAIQGTPNIKSAIATATAALGGRKT